MIEFTPYASGSSGNCYRITDGRTPLLLECGISINDILRNLKFGVSSLAGCLLSHGHSDHSRAVKDLMKFGVDIYLSQGTADEISGLGPWRHRINIIKARQQFRIGTWTILPFETQHDAAEPLGFLLANQDGEKCLYLSDTMYCKYRFQGLTHIMIEANYSLDILKRNVEAGLVEQALKSRIIKSHFSLENVKEFLKANDLSKVQEIWLLHLSEQNSCEKRFKEEVQKITGKPTYIA
jgi:phosphoribosyl 1,2-cyclic phosphodiesterase